MKRLAAPLLATLLLVGCAGVAGTPPGGAEPAPDTVVLQVERQGGFAPAAQAFAQIPSLTVYADGRAIVMGPQIAIYPAPALPNLLVHDVSDEQLAALIELASQAGLLVEPPDYGQPPIADAMTTVATLSVNDSRYVHQAYALDFALNLPGAEREQPLQGVSEQEQQARDALSQFIEAATKLVRAAGEVREYEPDAFAIVASAVDDDSTDAGEFGVEPTVLAWPIDARLDAAGDCLIVGGAAEALYTVLRDANQLTRFEQDDTVYEVASRPLLPGEVGCAAHD